MSDDAVTSEPTPSPGAERPDLAQRREDRSRRFVRICLAVLLVAMAAGGCMVYTFIPDITTDPAAVRDELDTLTGGLVVPAGLEPLRAVELNVLGMVPGRSAVFQSADQSRSLVASRFDGADELPASADLLPAETKVAVTERPIRILGESRPVRLGTLDPRNEQPPQRVATVWIATDRGVLQVTLAGPAASFDDEAAVRTLRTIGGGSPDDSPANDSPADDSPPAMTTPGDGSEEAAP